MPSNGMAETAGVSDQDIGQIKEKDRSSVFDGCYRRVKKGLAWVFHGHGRLVGRYPLPFVILPILVFGGLGAGLTQMESETGVEEVYFPLDSRAKGEREIVRTTFPHISYQHYNDFSKSDSEDSLSLMFFGKGSSTGNVLSPDALVEIRAILGKVQSMAVTSAWGSTTTLGHMCAKASGKCVIEGDYVVTADFEANLRAKSVTYPAWTFSGKPVDVSAALTDVKTDDAGKLLSAGISKISARLAYYDWDWMDKFEILISSEKTTYVRVGH